MTSPPGKVPSPTPSPTAGRSVNLPSELVAGLESRLKGSGFTSVDDFLAFLVARLLEMPAHEGEVFSAEDEEKLKGHLRSLGYLD